MPSIRIEQRSNDGAVRLSFDEGGSYEVAVTDPFAGDTDRERLVSWYFEQHLCFPFINQAKAARAEQALFDYGESLFGQIFTVQPEAFAEYVELRRNGFDGCRIVVTGSGPFHRLHWEALRDPTVDKPLAVRVPIVRRLGELTAPFRPGDTSPTLNLLVVTARPDGACDVGYRTVSRPLVDAVERGRLMVDVDLVRPGTWKALQTHLAGIKRAGNGSGHYHVIHFDLHGAVIDHDTLAAGQAADRYRFFSGTGDVPPFEGTQGFLFFETAEVGQAEPVPASAVAGLLAEHRIPIAILNACQSAQARDSSEASLAHELTAAGVPVALGMAYSVTVSAAALAMPAIYAQLADGADAVQAIHAGREQFHLSKQRKAYFDTTINLEDWVLLLILDNLESVTAATMSIPHALEPAERERLAAFLGRLAGARSLVLYGSRQSEAWLQADPARHTAARHAHAQLYRTLGPEIHQLLTTTSASEYRASCRPLDSSMGIADPSELLGRPAGCSERCPGAASTARGVIDQKALCPMSRRYRAYPTDAQQAHLLGHCEHARFVWNLCMQQQDYHDRYRRSNNYPAWPTSQDLRDARAESSWLAAGSSSVQQQALRDYVAAMGRWFKALETAHRKGRKLPGRPDWRRKRKGQGFVIRDVKVQKLNRHWSQVQIPKHDDHGPATWLRFSLSRPLPAKSTTARVTVDKAGRWHVSFSAEPEAIDREPTGAVIGVDRGVANTLATSDGTFDQAPSLSDGEQAEFERRQYELSCSPKGSPEWEQHRRVIARTYARLADRRKDWTEKSTTQLVRDYDVIVVEGLQILNMVRSAKGTVENPGTNVSAKAKLNRAILAQCWGLWLQRLNTKAVLAGVQVIEVPAAYTSQECCRCGHRAKENRLSQAEFVCVECGHEGHADINAAQNVLARGLRQGGWTGLGTTRGAA